MKNKISLRHWWLVVCTLGIILFSILFFFRVDSKSIQPKSNVAPKDNSSIVINQVQHGLPAHLRIPSINIDAPVESVGITLDGLMDVPQKPNDVAWFNLGPLPGEKGVAVIDGHSGYKNNKKAAFDNLTKLTIGSLIYVEDSYGTVSTFIVRKMQSYRPDQDATPVFSSSDTGIHLNLITCNGVWDPQQKSHSTRLVVFADYFK